MFFPSAQIKSTPADVGLAYTALRLSVNASTGDAAAAESWISGWWLPPSEANSPVLLYLHGNGSNLGDLVHRAQRFHRWGYGMLLIDYRGYGDSSGPFPNEQRVYEDTATAWNYLTDQQNIPADRIVLYGRSIGGAIAINLATEHPEAAGLIVESSFTSMQAMVSHRLLLPLPLDWLLTQQFDSLTKVRSLQVPVLLFHGTADRVVPAFMSQTLYDAIAQSQPNLLTTLVWIEQAGHSDLPMVGGHRYAQSIQQFIQSVTQ